MTYKLAGTGSKALDRDLAMPQVGRNSSDAAGGMKVLNLFAYTGGSTLAAAAAGAAVTHVDAARNIVAWARHNTELSALGHAPIRWIAEDAVKFVRREVRRGNHYDAVILDPPSYGHGPHGEVWRLAEDLPPLLALCAELTAGRPRFVLLTCHTPGFAPDRLRELLAAAFGLSPSARDRCRTAGDRGVHRPDLAQRRRVAMDGGVAGTLRVPSARRGKNRLHASSLAKRPARAR